MRLVVLLAVALTVSAVQCVSACAEQDCGSKSAPCHQHDSSKQVKCSQEIPAAKAPTIVPAVPTLAIAAAAPFATAAPLPADPLLIDSVSSPPPLTLRI